MQDDAVARELGQFGLQQGQAQAVDALLIGDGGARRGGVSLGDGNQALQVGAGAGAVQQLSLFGEHQTVVSAGVDVAL
ncbi:hypothetical protein D3C78_1398210 [compost metagenome]